MWLSETTAIELGMAGRHDRNMSTRPGEQGIALAAAVFALVVIGALVAAVFHLALLEQRVGYSTIGFRQAFSAAEEGAYGRVASWDAGTYNELDDGDTLSFQSPSDRVGGWYRGSIRRLNRELFLVRSEGFSPDSTARSHIGLLVRLQALGLPIQGALEVHGSLVISGTASVDGSDHSPNGWACPSPGPPVTGVVVRDSQGIDPSSCGGLLCVSGSPAVRVDSALAAPPLSLGSLDLGSLLQTATHVLSGGARLIQPSTLDGVCNLADPNNWGDPLAPDGACGAHFPIIVNQGDLSLVGGRGQGILLVDGDLEITGGLRFFGVIVVLGQLRTRGSGGYVTGAVIAEHVALQQGSVLGITAIQYSRCTVWGATRAWGLASPLRQRSWANLR